jgi:hypothetical protein
LPLLAALAAYTSAGANVTFISADAGNDVAMYNNITSTSDEVTFDKSVHDRITDLGTRNYVAGFSYGRDPAYPGGMQGSALINEVFSGADQIHIYSYNVARAVQSAPLALAFSYAFYDFSIDTESTLTLDFQNSETGSHDSHSASSAYWNLSSDKFNDTIIPMGTGDLVLDLPVGRYALDLRVNSAADIRSNLAGVETSDTLDLSFSIKPQQQQPTPPEPGHDLPEPATLFLLGPSLLGVLVTRISRAAARSGRHRRGWCHPAGQ